MAVGLCATAMVWASSASAEEPSRSAAEPEEPGEPAKVELSIDLEAPDVRVECQSFRTSCGAPCVLQLPPGYYTVSTPEASKEIFVDRSSHLRLTRGSPGAKTASLVLLLTGVIVTVAAIAIPLYVCRRGDLEVDAYGRQYIPPNPCRDVSDGVKVAWIAGGGAGLTLGLVGGIGLAISGPRLTMSF